MGEQASSAIIQHAVVHGGRGAVYLDQDVPSVEGELTGELGSVVRRGTVEGGGRLGRHGMGRACRMDWG